MAVRFFISYKRHDPDTEQLLPALRQALKTFGYEVFVDVDIEPGTAWEKELRDNIECADEFLLLLSAAAAASDRVEDEVRIADTFRTSRNRKPRIIPIYINLDDPGKPALKRILDDIEHLSWVSEADTPRVAETIHAMVRRRRHLGIIAKAVAGVIAALLIVLFVRSAVQIARIRNARSSMADALAAYARLRADERWLAPRLWLIGPWKPERLAAQALDERAAPLLVSNNRSEVEQGLLLAAQAAVMRGGDVSNSARGTYEAQHYDLLVTTIDAQEEISGRALAVSAGGVEWRIAIGGRVWTCPEPVGQRECVPFAKRSRQSFVVASAFDSADVLSLVGYSGEMTKLDLRTGDEQGGASAATFVAADRGDVATSFNHGGAGGFSVTVDLAGPSLRPRDSGDLGDLSMLALGPCDDCVSTLGINGNVKIWHWNSGRNAKPTILPGKALWLAATRTAHRLAVVTDGGDVAFYSADGHPDGIGNQIDLTQVEWMAISPDGRHLAVVHDGNVTVFDDGANFRTLIAKIKKPKPIAAAFAGDDYLVTRTPSDIRVWRLRSAERRDLAPEQRWAEWRKKFGRVAGDLVARRN